MTSRRATAEDATTSKQRRDANDEDGARHGDDGEHPDKPGTPTKVTKPSWKFIARKTYREFTADECTDIAAALTYFAVLSLFPAALVLLSLLGVLGQGQQTVDTLLQIVRDVGSASVADSLSGPLQTVSQAPGAGLALVIGILSALWTASGYVGAFGRAMNRMYDIGEGRPVWKLRPLLLVITAGLLILVAAAALILVVSGSVAGAIGDAVGLGSTAVTVWSIAKWPVLLIFVVVIVALLYYATPNVKKPKLKWISIGSLVAILTWIVASVLFGFYIANFSSYSKTYGSLAGIVIFLLWLWITNLALLFGAELDAELERGRQLQAGIPAEETVQLPPRDTKNIKKEEDAHAKDVAKGRTLRQTQGASQDTDDDAGPDRGTAAETTQRWRSH